MKKSFTIILISICSILMFSGCSRGKLTMTGRCLVAANGAYIIFDANDMPVVMRNQSNDKALFNGLHTGDKIKITHDGIHAGNPGQADVSSCSIIERGSLEDVPQNSRDEWKAQGWIAETEPDAAAVYAPVLESWEKAIGEDFGYSAGVQNGTQYPFICQYLPNEFRQAHYAYYDIDGNGVPELLIASFYDFGYYYLADVFTIHEEHPVRLFEGVEDRGFWSRNRLDFSADGKSLICTGSSGAAYTTTDFYRIAGNGYQVELLEGLTTFNPEKPEEDTAHYRQPDGTYEIAADYDGVMEKYYGQKYSQRDETPDYSSDFHTTIDWSPIVPNR